MTHEIDRVLRAFASQAWFIEPRKGAQIAAMLALRHAEGPRERPWRADSGLAPSQRVPGLAYVGRVAVVRLIGPIFPRAESVSDISQPAALMTDFQRAFRAAASDSTASAIVIEIDSPGGQVDLVPETAAMIRAARRADRPIVAVANTLAASAAYWIASAADQVSVTPSGEVGSIGVYAVVEEISQALEQAGVRVQVVREGPRKAEFLPYAPIGAEAIAALQASVSYFYSMFVRDVARGRNVAESLVRADPEQADTSFGGGRVIPARQAVALGMADRVETLDAVLQRLSKVGGRSTASARAAIV